MQLYYLRSSKQMRLLDLESKTPLYTLLTEMSDGLQHIRAFGWESVYFAKGLANLDHSQKPFYCMFCIQRWLILVVGLCVVVISATLVSFALTFSVTTQSSLGLSMLIAMKVSTVFADVIEFCVDLETSLGSVSRLASFIGETASEAADEQGLWPLYQTTGRTEETLSSLTLTPNTQLRPLVMRHFAKYRQ